MRGRIELPVRAEHALNTLNIFITSSARTDKSRRPRIYCIGPKSLTSRSMEVCVLCVKDGVADAHPWVESHAQSASLRMNKNSRNRQQTLRGLRAVNASDLSPALQIWFPLARVVLERKRKYALT